jgi:predicted O-methyltransferase YrrM
MRDLTKDLSPQETYLHHLFPAEPTPLFQQSRDAAEELGKERISLSHWEARLMSTLIHSHGCKKFVEIGTLTGTSALWILQGLKTGGELWTFEKDLDHGKQAKEILKQYQKSQDQKKVHLMEGDAQVLLSTIESEGPFDGIFIDGNKSAYINYLNWAETNLKKGALIIADNVYLGGSVFTGNAADFSKKQIEVMKAFNQRLADPEKYFSSIVPTGEGLFVAVKLF